MNTEMRDLLKRIAPIVGNEKVSRYWNSYLIADEIERRELQRVIEVYAARLLRDHPSAPLPGLFPPPTKSACAGEISLGNVMYGGKELHELRMPLNSALRHLGVFGASGSGKSNLTALLFDTFVNNNVPVTLLDFKKTFRSLARDYPSLVVFTVGNERVAPFHFNPLIPPPRVPYETWTGRVLSCLNLAFMLGPGAESLLSSAMAQCYREAAAQHRWPTFVDIEKALEQVAPRGRKGMWLESARRAIQALSSGNAANVFCSEDSLRLDEFLQTTAVCELEGLGAAEQCFLSSTLLLWILYFRMNEETARESLKHVLIIEEAQNLIGVQKSGFGDGTEPAIFKALREARELSESIITVTQHPSSIPLPIFGNQACTVSLALKHAADIRAVSQAMVLRDEARDALVNLPVGEAIVRTPDQMPCHVRFPHRKLLKGSVTDVELRERFLASPYSTNTTTFRVRHAEADSSGLIPPPDDKRVIQSESSTPQAKIGYPLSDYTPPTTPEKETGKADISKPSELECAFFRDIVEHPFDGVVQRIKRLGTSRRKGVAALHSLEQRALTKPANIFTGTSLLKLFDLTSDGRFLANALGCKLPNPNEGGIEHRYWVHNAVRQMRKGGWTATPEYAASDDLIVDIHIECDNRRIAILIETGKSKVENNLVKTAACGYDVVVVASQRADVQRRIAKCFRQISAPGTLLLTTPPNINDVLRPVLAEVASK